MPANPHPEQIINVDLNNQLLLNTEVLQKILLRDEIKNLNAVVISIVGTYRQGKSFILNFFLRFLNATCEKKNVSDWLDSSDGDLSGFKWTASSKRETVGIMMWSEVFLANLPSGEEVAIILLDTQGTFDNQTSIKDCATIFALSTLLSSVQIFNIKDNIKQNDLIYLKDFLEYGQLLSEDTPDKAPFQNLMFLIRDWAFPDEHSYGEDGGQQYLNSVLDRSPDDPDDVTFLKQSVRKFFQKTWAFLLPYPGREVASKGTANLDKIDDNFKKFVQILVSKILDSSSLTVKEIGGGKVKVHELYRLIEGYYEHFRTGKMPQLQSIFEATAQVQHQSAIEESIKEYDNLMVSVKDPNSASISDKDLFDQHTQSKNSAFEKFEETKKMGDDNIKQRYKLKLTEKLDEVYSQYVSTNYMKREIEEKLKEKERVIQQQKENEEKVAQLKIDFAEISKTLQEQKEERKEEKLKMEQRLKDAEREKEENERRIRELNKDVDGLRQTLISDVVMKVAEVGTKLYQMHLEKQTQLEVAKIKTDALKKNVEAEPKKDQ